LRFFKDEEVVTAVIYRGIVRIFEGYLSYSQWRDKDFGNPKTATEFQIIQSNKKLPNSPN
jgi:hypothetical protein